MFSIKRTLLLSLTSLVIFGGLYSFLISNQPKVAEKPSVLQSTTNLFESLTQAQKDCIRADLGDSLYQALNQGTATPTSYEQGVITNCTNSGGTSSTSSSGSGSGSGSSTTCTSGYYWDSSTSTCKPNTSTTTMTCPSGWTYHATAYNGSPGCVQYSGSTIICGSGYTYNGTYCLPSTSGSGSGSSSTTCGTGYYWNGSYCAANGTTSTTCGSGYYWNGSSCAPSTSTTCGTGYYWNGSSCVSNSTNPTTGGSGSNYCATGSYWNGSYCTSTNSYPQGTNTCPSGWSYSSTAYNGYGGCIQTSGGTVTCGSGYNWNGGSCMPNSTINTNCGVGYEWKGTSCQPISSTSVNSSGYTYNSTLTNYNPFTNMDPKIMDCWKGKIGQLRLDSIKTGTTPTPEEYNFLNTCYSQVSPTTTTTTNPTTGNYSLGGLRFPNKSTQSDCAAKALGSDYDWFNNLANPSSTGDYTRFENLNKKIQNCFATQGAQATTLAAPKYFVSPLMAACLKEAWGQTRFNEISSGNSYPTPTERNATEECNLKVTGVTRPQIQYSTANTIDANAVSCLKLALGEARFNAIYSGQTPPTNEEISKGKICFGSTDATLVPPATYKVDTKINDCVNAAVTSDRLNKIMSGGASPTEDDKRKINLCFQNINKTQQSFLPLPPTQIPFLNVDSSKAKVEKTETTFIKNVEGKETPTITFKGKGNPSQNIDLYLFSDPIVVTVKTDANGVWTYNLDAPLNPGNHSAYVAVKGASDSVRSEVFNFSIAQAAETSSRNSGLIVPTQTVSNQTRNYLSTVIGIIVFGILVLIGIVIYLEKRKVQTPN